MCNFKLGSCRKLRLRHIFEKAFYGFSLCLLKDHAMAEGISAKSVLNIFIKHHTFTLKKNFSKIYVII